MHRRTSCNTATTKKSADRQAHQEPSNAGTLVIAQAHTAVEDIKGQQVVNTVTERLLEAPITLTQSELRTLVPNIWAQAVSTTECKREEPIALAMLGEVFSNQYKLEAPVTTARGPRIARIADKYAATVLALSQPSALPLYQPFPSDPSHPKPSELEPCPSALASITHAEQSQYVTVAEDTHDRYEHIARDQVESQLPRLAADEPEVATQPAATEASRKGAHEVAPPPILPLPTPFIACAAAEVAERPLPTVTQPVAAEATQSLAVTTEATQSLAIAAEATQSVVATEATASFVTAEATPLFFVAAEAPQSLGMIVQQQHALSPSPLLPWHSPFKPFSPLLTSYHHVPNLDFSRCSLQPPQCRPPSEPPPTHKTACSAATRVTPAKSRALIHFYLPHTRTRTNPMLETAFFFSWEENWGTAQPSKCCIRTLATSPSKHPSAANSPQTHPAIRTHPQPFSLISLSSPQIVPTFPQNATLARGLGNFVSTRSRPRPLLFPNYKTRRGVLNYTHARLATDPLKSKNSSSLTSSTVPHASADFKTQFRHVPYLDQYPYPVMRRAETCTTACAQHFSSIPSSEDQPSLPFPQNTVLARSISNSVSMCPSTPAAAEETFTAERSPVVNATSHSKEDSMSLREDYLCGPFLTFSTTPHAL